MANVEMGVDRDRESIKQRFAAEKHSANGLFLFFVAQHVFRTGCTRRISFACSSLI
jgi:hypothetical protein